MKIRNFLFALMLTVFAIASVASAQQGTSSPNGYNAASHVLGSYGETIDQVEFTVPNVLALHQYGNFRPGAYVQVSVPLTNNTGRTVECSVAKATGSYSGATGLGMRLAEVVPGSNITVAPNAVGTILYFLEFAPESQWQAGDFGQTAQVNVRVKCVGILPAYQNATH